MARPIHVFVINAGDCGACAAEVWAAIEGSADLVWAATPSEADVIALTGSVTSAVRNALLATYAAFGRDRLPVVAIGRCAVDGYPFGRAGTAALPEIPIHRRLDGSPPLVDLIVEALIDATRGTAAETTRQ